MRRQGYGAFCKLCCATRYANIIFEKYGYTLRKNS